MIETIKKVATSVETKNVPIATSSVAVMDIKNDDGDEEAPNQGGILTFNIDSSTNLSNLDIGRNTTEPPSLMVSL